MAKKLNKSLSIKDETNNVVVDVEMTFININISCQANVLTTIGKKQHPQYSISENISVSLPLNTEEEVAKAIELFPDAEANIKQLFDKISARFA